MHEVVDDGDDHPEIDAAATQSPPRSVDGGHPCIVQYFLPRATVSPTPRLLPLIQYTSTSHSLYLLLFLRLQSLV